MTNIQRIRAKQCFAVLLVIIFAALWASAEFGLVPVPRILSGICCVLAAVHLGWRIEHDRTRWKRADATMVALYGVGLFKNGGVERLKKVFEAFLAKKESFDKFGCTNLMLSDEVSRELSGFLREQKSVSQKQ